MEGTSLKPDIRVPEQKTANLSFCDTTPKAFKQWIGLLPMANIGEVSRQLYHAIIELLDAGNPDKNRKVLAIAIHRSIAELSGTILRAYQLYCPPPQTAGWIVISFTDLRSHTS
ncbi:hypothetical protein [Marinobacter gelidimuriae]|uniref:hypothetical protein n=1 Tax=Marinobacter gelidimuriae TaxID=2739064 RepID=UPI0003A51396|nr:hypothetical protein [Marinobacter gelidimuriae]